MLNVGALREGYVLDHIKAGKAMTIYHDLKLDKLDCTVAIIKNARSNKMGKKDIIKVECPVENLDLDILGFIDHNITVNVIKDEKIVAKKELKLPNQVVNVIKCKNPRCITYIEQGLDQILFLQIKRKKFTDVNTAKRNTQVNAINNKTHIKKTERKKSVLSDCRQSPAFAGFCYCWSRFSDIINIRRAVFFYDDQKRR